MTRRGCPKIQTSFNPLKGGAWVRTARSRSARGSVQEVRRARVGIMPQIGAHFKGDFGALFLVLDCGKLNKLAVELSESATFPIADFLG